HFLSFPTRRSSDLCVFSLDVSFVLRRLVSPTRSLSCQSGPASFVCLRRQRKTFIRILQGLPVCTWIDILRTLIIRPFARGSSVRITPQHFVPQLVPPL